MNDFLVRIIDHKKQEISRLDTAFLRRAAEEAPRPRNFLAEMEKAKSDQPVRLIAELKRASPSKGILAPQLDLFDVAEIYAQNGASAISVLTDEKFFLGKLDTLRELRLVRTSALPLLRKDFIIADSQLYESAAAGADSILIIVAALPDNLLLKDLHTLALELGLTPLVEVHNQAEVERSLDIEDIKLIGINNRDLSTFEISLSTTERLRPLIPPDIKVVSESGIFTGKDVSRLISARVDAILVGEALVTAPDIAGKVRELAFVEGVM